MSASCADDPYLSDSTETNGHDVRTPRAGVHAGAMARGDLLAIEDDRHVVVLRCRFHRVAQRVELVDLRAQMETDLQHVLHRFRLLQRFRFDEFIGAAVGHARVQARTRSCASRTFVVVNIPNIFDAVGETPKGDLQLQILGHGLLGLVVTFDEFERDQSRDGFRRQVN